MPSVLENRLSAIQWTSPTCFTLDGLDFALEDWGKPYVGDAYPVMKPREYLAAYCQALAGLSIRNVLELGIMRGGSAVFFSVLLQPEKLVSLDVSGPVRVLEKFRTEHPDGQRVSTRYYTSQDDEAALTAILEKDFDGPLDLVLDDASHDYFLTRSSFEILFPRLRPGGCYVIEDWQWAHQPGIYIWKDKPALSNLVYQLLMICAGRPDLIAQVQVFPSITFVWRGASPPATERLDVDGLCWTQGRPFHLL